MRYYSSMHCSVPGSGVLSLGYCLFGCLYGKQRSRSEQISQINEKSKYLFKLFSLLTNHKCFVSDNITEICIRS